MRVRTCTWRNDGDARGAGRDRVARRDGPPRPPWASPRGRTARAALLSVCAAGWSCGRSAPETRGAPPATYAPAPDSARASGTLAAGGWPRLSYAGLGPGDVPHYITRRFSPHERALLRAVFGITDPNRLYLSDSSELGYLKYDTARKHDAQHYVYTFRPGFISLRRPGESWEGFQRRVLRMRPADFPASARRADRSLADLDPDVRGLFQGMIAAARARGFRIQPTETLRTPTREAYLMSRADGFTYTATSLHSYGRAVDVEIGNGDIADPRTRARYVAFRRWVLRWGAGRLRLVGTPAGTWDFNHVEAPAPWLGYHSIEALLAAARRCLAGPPPSAIAPARCTFEPRAGPGE